MKYAHSVAEYTVLSIKPNRKYTIHTCNLCKFCW